MEYNSKIARLQGQLEAIEQMLGSTSDILMRTSLENRVAFLKQQIETASDNGPVLGALIIIHEGVLIS